MEYRDYYRVLGVDRNADQKAIKKAYRQLARQYHPDVNPGDRQSESRFKEINEAYEVLGDPDKRQKYDRLGANWRAYQTAGQDPSGFDWSRWTTGAPGGRTRVDYSDLNDLFGQRSFSDFFQTIFGGASAARTTSNMNDPSSGTGPFQPRSMRGSDAEHPVEITLDEAFHGTQRTLSIDNRRIEVKIPSGVRTGSRVRVAGEGYSSTSAGPAGDLYLVVQVQPHALFEREGDDLTAVLPLDVYTAVLGGEATVPTMTGKATLRIPPGTQPGQMFRLRGQGMPSVRDPSKRGNLLVKAQVRVPKHLSEKQRMLFKELADLDVEQP